jgi:hypothetical protein
MPHLAALIIRQSQPSVSRSIFHMRDTGRHGPSQVAPARLTAADHNAFWRYERGEAVPLPALMSLFRLLDKHPNLLKNLV